MDTSLTRPGKSSLATSAAQIASILRESDKLDVRPRDGYSFEKSTLNTSTFGGGAGYPTYSEAVVHATMQRQLDMLNDRCMSMIASVQRQVELDRREIERAVGVLEGKLETRIAPFAEQLNRTEQRVAELQGARSATADELDQLRRKVFDATGGAGPLTSMGGPLTATLNGGDQTPVGLHFGRSLNGVEGSASKELGSHGDDKLHALNMRLEEMQQKFKISNMELNDAVKKWSQRIRKIEHAICSNNSQVMSQLDNFSRNQSHAASPSDPEGAGEGWESRLRQMEIKFSDFQGKMMSLDHQLADVKISLEYSKNDKDMKGFQKGLDNWKLAIGHSPMKHSPDDFPDDMSHVMSDGQHADRSKSPRDNHGGSSSLKALQRQFLDFQQALTNLKYKHESLNQKSEHADRKLENLVRLPNLMETQRRDLVNLSDKFRLELQNEADRLNRKIELLEENLRDQSISFNIDGDTTLHKESASSMMGGGAASIRGDRSRLGGGNAALNVQEHVSKVTENLKQTFANEIAKLEVDLNGRVDKVAADAQSMVNECRESAKDAVKHKLLEFSKNEIAPIRASSTEVATKLESIETEILKDHAKRFGDIFETLNRNTDLYRDQTENRVSELRYEFRDLVREAETRLLKDADSRLRNDQTDTKVNQLGKNQVQFEQSVAKDVSGLKFHIDHCFRMLGTSAAHAQAGTPHQTAVLRGDHEEETKQLLEKVDATIQENHEVLDTRVTELEEALRQELLLLKNKSEEAFNASNANMTHDEDARLHKRVADFQALLDQQKVLVESRCDELADFNRATVMELKDTTRQHIADRFEEMDKTVQSSLTESYNQLRDEVLLENEKYSKQFMEKCVEEIRIQLAQEVDSKLADLDQKQMTLKSNDSEIERVELAELTKRVEDASAKATLAFQEFGSYDKKLNTYDQKIDQIEKSDLEFGALLSKLHEKTDVWESELRNLIRAEVDTFMAKIGLDGKASSFSDLRSPQKSPTVALASPTRASPGNGSTNNVLLAQFELKCQHLESDLKKNETNMKKAIDRGADAQIASKLAQETAEVAGAKVDQLADQMIILNGQLAELRRKIEEVGFDAKCDSENTTNALTAKTTQLSDTLKSLESRIQMSIDGKLNFDGPAPKESNPNLNRLGPSVRSPSGSNRVKSALQFLPEGRKSQSIDENTPLTARLEQTKAAILNEVKHIGVSPRNPTGAFQLNTTSSDLPQIQSAIDLTLTDFRIALPEEECIRELKQWMSVKSDEDEEMRATVQKLRRDVDSLHLRKSPRGTEPDVETVFSEKIFGLENALQALEANLEHRLRDIEKRLPNADAHRGNDNSNGYADFASPRGEGGGSGDMHRGGRADGINVTSPGGTTKNVFGRSIYHHEHMFDCSPSKQDDRYNMKIKLDKDRGSRSPIGSRSPSMRNSLSIHQQEQLVEFLKQNKLDELRSLVSKIQSFDTDALAKYQATINKSPGQSAKLSEELQETRGICDSAQKRIDELAQQVEGFLKNPKFQQMLSASQTSPELLSSLSKWEGVKEGVGTRGHISAENRSIEHMSVGSQKFGNQNDKSMQNDKSVRYGNNMNKSMNNDLRSNNLRFSAAMAEPGADSSMRASSGYDNMSFNNNLDDDVMQSPEIKTKTKFHKHRHDNSAPFGLHDSSEGVQNLDKGLMNPMRSILRDSAEKNLILDSIDSNGKIVPSSGNGFTLSGMGNSALGKSNIGASNNRYGGAAPGGLTENTLDSFGEGLGGLRGNTGLGGGPKVSDVLKMSSDSIAMGKNLSKDGFHNTGQGISLDIPAEDMQDSSVNLSQNNLSQNMSSIQENKQSSPRDPDQVRMDDASPPLPQRTMSAITSTLPAVTLQAPGGSSLQPLGGSSLPPLGGDTRGSSNSRLTPVSGGSSKRNDPEDLMKNDFDDDSDIAEDILVEEGMDIDNSHGSKNPEDDMVSNNAASNPPNNRTVEDTGNEDDFAVRVNEIDENGDLTDSPAGVLRDGRGLQGLSTDGQTRSAGGQRRPEVVGSAPEHVNLEEPEKVSEDGISERDKYSEPDVGFVSDQEEPTNSPEDIMGTMASAHNQNMAANLGNNLNNLNNRLGGPLGRATAMPSAGGRYGTPAGSFDPKEGNSPMMGLDSHKNMGSSKSNNILNKGPGGDINHVFADGSSSKLPALGQKKKEDFDLDIKFSDDDINDFEADSDVIKFIDEKKLIDPFQDESFKADLKDESFKADDSFKQEPDDSSRNDPFKTDALPPFKEDPLPPFHTESLDFSKDFSKDFSQDLGIPTLDMSGGLDTSGGLILAGSFDSPSGLPPLVQPGQSSDFTKGDLPPLNEASLDDTANLNVNDSPKLNDVDDSMKFDADSPVFAQSSLNQPPSTLAQPPAPRIEVRSVQQPTQIQKEDVVEEKEYATKELPANKLDREITVQGGMGDIEDSADESDPSEEVLQSRLQKLDSTLEGLRALRPPENDLSFDDDFSLDLGLDKDLKKPLDLPSKDTQPRQTKQIQMSDDSISDDDMLSKLMNKNSNKPSAKPSPTSGANVTNASADAVLGQLKKAGSPSASEKRDELSETFDADEFLQKRLEPLKAHSRSNSKSSNSLSLREDGPGDDLGKTMGGTVGGTVNGNPNKRGESKSSSSFDENDVDALFNKEMTKKDEGAKAKKSAAPPLGGGLMNLSGGGLSGMPGGGDALSGLLGTTGGLSGSGGFSKKPGGIPSLGPLGNAPSLGRLGNRGVSGGLGPLKPLAPVTGSGLGSRPDSQKSSPKDAFGKDNPGDRFSTAPKEMDAIDAILGASSSEHSSARPKQSPKQTGSNSSSKKVSPRINPFPDDFFDDEVNLSSDSEGSELLNFGGAYEGKHENSAQENKSASSFPENKGAPENRSAQENPSTMMVLPPSGTKAHVENKFSDSPEDDMSIPESIQESIDGGGWGGSD